MLSQLQSLQCMSFKQKTHISFPFFSKYHTLEVPLRDNYQSLVLCNCKPIFRNYNIELIVDIIMLLLLELPITLYSQDDDLLGKLIHYLVYAIVPLKYPFPVITDLPLKMEMLLESPFPTLIGCKRIETV